MPAIVGGNMRRARERDRQPEHAERPVQFTPQHKEFRTVKAIAQWTTAACAVAALITLSGCASMQDMKGVQDEVMSLKSDLAAAQSALDAAMKEAKAAAMAAGDAANAANAAMTAGNDAAATSAANAEKLDRMFEKLMMK